MDELGVQRLWLHAESLAFAHPVTHQTLSIVAPRGIEWSRLASLSGWIDGRDVARTP